MNDSGAAIQLSSILMFIVAFLFFIENYFNQNKRFSFSKNTQLASLTKPNNSVKFLIYVICLVPIILAFLIPVLFNLINIFSSYDDINFERLLSITFNSITVSMIASVLILIISTFFL